jgi:hypothetical protein
VRDAFLAAGHDAYSCDLLPTLSPGPHFRGDVLSLLSDGWDMMIAHPPCTDLAVSGARWFPAKWADGRIESALAFVSALFAAPIPFVCIENPVSLISSRIRKPDQIIQPWQFGHGEVKTTCLWLKGLPLLRPTEIVSGRRQACWRAPDSAGRAQRRSLTYPGVAAAMASQWPGTLSPPRVPGLRGDRGRACVLPEGAARLTLAR